MAYGYFKDLDRRTFADKTLRNKAFNIAKEPKYERYQRGLASMVYKFFDKKASRSGLKNEKFSNKELVKELIQLLETLMKEKYNHLLLTIFVMQI